MCVCVIVCQRYHNILNKTQQNNTAWHGMASYTYIHVYLLGHHGEKVGRIDREEEVYIERYIQQTGEKTACE